MTEASIFTFIKSLILNILHKASEGNFFYVYVLHTTWNTIFTNYLVHPFLQEAGTQLVKKLPGL